MNNATQTGNSKMTNQEQAIIDEAMEEMEERREHSDWIQGLIAQAEASTPATTNHVDHGAMPEGWVPGVSSNGFKRPALRA